ncbi:hypothetical protein ACET3X_004939 [Alternaria dauci]|uniref:Uncharacterized protein n=1 Tax=Alternaria dauci TaxID=48095 RepID=A0ABR3ULB4_9PLEO
MARSLLLATSALLAVLSLLAQAKEKNELRTYAFASDDCNGATHRGNMDLKLGKCKDIVIGANSIKPFHNKHEAWIGRINQGGPPCYLVTFQHHGCKGLATSISPLPEAISECISPDHDEPFLSVLFDCYKAETITVPNPHVVTVHTPFVSSQWVHTSNSLTPLESTTDAVYVTTPLPVVTVFPESTVTVVMPPPESVETVTILPPSTTTVTVYGGNYGRSHMHHSDLHQESVAKVPQDLEPRNKKKWKGPRIGVWMLHPWTAAVICYECYAKSPSNTFKFECRSGPKNPVDCKGPVPDPQNVVTVTHAPVVTVTAGDPTTSVIIVTATQPPPVTTVVSPAVTGQTVYTMVGGKPVYTIVNQTVHTAELGQQEGHLEPRSFHRAVRFTHPFQPGTEMCADGEWDGRGKDRGEIRIQKPSKDMKKCEKDHEVQLIDASPRTTTVELPTRTIAVSTSTVYPPSVVTVNPSPPVVTVTTVVGSAPAPPLITVTVSPESSYSTVTTIIGSAPAPPVVTVTVNPASDYSTITTIFNTAPDYSTITTIFDAEPPCTTVTVLHEADPTSYIISRRHYDL